MANKKSKPSDDEEEMKKQYKLLLYLGEVEMVHDLHLLHGADSATSTATATSVGDGESQ
mgnify:CR=1 FL=1